VPDRAAIWGSFCGYSETGHHPDDLRLGRSQHHGRRSPKRWVSGSALASTSLAGPLLADSSLGLSGLRRLLREIRLGDHFTGGIQYRLNPGVVKTSGLPGVAAPGRTGTVCL
jgi:hypothetical protein